MELDATDAAIVRELRSDGRLAFETLAGRVGLSRAAARLRVRRLLDSGAIRVVGIVHPAVRGIGALAHLAIGVGDTATGVAELVAGLPEVTLVSLTAGRFPLVAEVRGHDLPCLTATIGQVRTAHGVRTIDTAVYTHVLKDPYLAFSTPPTIEPDDVDLRMLSLLEDDGRISFADLAEHVDLSPGAVRSRVLRLLRGRAIRVTAVLDPGAIGRTQQGGFALRLDGDGQLATTEIASWEDTRFLASCLGGADLIGTVTATSVSGLRSIFERLRELPGVHVIETWVHLERVKERSDAPGLTLSPGQG